METEKNK